MKLNKVFYATIVFEDKQGRLTGYSETSKGIKLYWIGGHSVARVLGRNTIQYFI